LRSSSPGIAGTIIGAIQSLRPDWTDGTWLGPHRRTAGPRAICDSPTILSSLPRMVHRRPRMAVAVADPCPASVSVALGVVFVFGIVLTGSRTGIADFVLLALWALLDRKLPVGCVCPLVVAPALYVVFWWGLAQWAHSTHHVFGRRGAHWAQQGDISSSRYAIWKKHFVLDRAAPVVWGVGFGDSTSRGR